MRLQPTQSAWHAQRYDAFHRDVGVCEFVAKPLYSVGFGGVRYYGLTARRYDITIGEWGQICWDKQMLPFCKKATKTLLRAATTAVLQGLMPAALCYDYQRYQTKPSLGGGHDMEQADILCERRGRVGVLTLNRPDKLNALTGAMQGELQRRIGEWNADERVGAIVVTGAGRAFSAGADVGGFEDFVRGDSAPQQAAARANDVDWVNLVRQSKPIVCALNGMAVGLGITLTLPCDVRVAAEDARISFRFLRIGLTPEYGSTHYLVNLVGLGRALEYMLAARFVSAQEAQAAGLVNHIYPADSLLDSAVALAQEIADNPSWHLAKVKRLIHENYMEKDLAWVIRRESETLRAARYTDAHKEALTAFRERREPKFH